MVFLIVIPEQDQFPLSQKPVFCTYSIHPENLKKKRKHEPNHFSIETMERNLKKGPILLGLQLGI